MKLHTVKNVAKMLGVSERRVRQLRDEGIIKERRPGLYNIIETNHNYINFLKGGSDKLNYGEERAKFIKAKRQKEELELAQMEGNLHESTYIKIIMVEALTNFKTRLLSIPAKLSPILAKKNNKTEIYKIISEAIEEALQELSDFDEFGHESEVAENENSE